MLALDRLNLDSWYGFQKVQMRDPFNPKEVLLITLGARWHLALGFERRDGSSVAFRLVADGENPSCELGVHGDVQSIRALEMSEKVPLASEVKFVFDGNSGRIHLGDLPEFELTFGDLADSRFFIRADGGLLGSTKSAPLIIQERVRRHLQPSITVVALAGLIFGLGFVFLDLGI